ncbi:reversion-inducing cysteine-rich protein with Kazal motifs-like [Schistocerca serialis cubense]|uniref:reversion-inducing cysteine-rich protein with Kazal motifs-like n=1 Tax=Schistocerca serialis cubense TaxID=2023355 RepID=UPI00214E581A|nr:reversion-inducing cysteine-rich protein with Kazal motifs-like [Schistocerca serialis cubense]
MCPEVGSEREPETQVSDSEILKEDCESLLQSCVDWRRAAPGLSPAAVCAQLSAGDRPCAPLEALLAPAGSEARVAPQDALTAPCRGRPCNHSRACLPNRDCAAGRPCHTHRCLPGCRLGEVSQYVVPGDTLVVVPQSTGCARLCRCPRHGGALHRCEPLPCAPPQPCWIGTTRIEHNSQFYLECNLCACSSGELTCTRRQCDSSAAAYSGQPCNCPPVYAPVCAASGVTYASACLARCAGAGDGELEAGACPERDPCSRHACPRGQHCVPLRRACLEGAPRHACRQHHCVEKVESCSSRPHDPVCDTEGEEHPNLCFLLHYWKALAYRGPCLKSCSLSGAVCGADGVTYRSECEAAAARVPLDYAGRCSGCRDPRRCPPLARQGCQPLRPPGACCPVCAGALILLYSRKQVELSVQAVRGDSQALTVRAVVAALERLVAVSECVVQGYAGVGPQLVVVVTARTPGRAPSHLQLEACAAEARKLSALVRARSPRLAAQLPLSLLLAAEDVTAAPETSSAQKPAGAGAWLLAFAVTLCLSRGCTRLHTHQASVD